MKLSLDDSVFMPFAENEVYILELLKELQTEIIYKESIESILTLSKEFRTAKEKFLDKYMVGNETYGLTSRELKIAKLAALRKTNAEIANELHLAEGTVRNQLSRVFDKLGICGEGKNKRIQLEEMLKIKK